MLRLERDAPVPARLRVVIVDDEPLARDCMRLALVDAPGVSVVAECGDGASAVEAIRMHAPDIVFLDVQMPGLDGFGVIERIGTADMPPVVFVTAFDTHAIRAFEVHALDYVLKPFDDQRLLAALDRARERAVERQQGELGRRLTAVVQAWNQGAEGGPRHAQGAAAPDEGGPGTADDEGRDWVEEAEDTRRPGRGTYIARFAVRGGGRVRFVTASEVDWIEADRNYVYLHVGEAKHRVRATLRHVTERLDPGIFVRIHRSAVVNVDRIREVQPWFGGDYIAILRTGAKLRVSRLRASQLLRPMT